MRTLNLSSYVHVFHNTAHERVSRRSQSCSRRQRYVIKRVMHAQSCCFAHKTNCFLTLSLSSSWWWSHLSSLLGLDSVEIKKEKLKDQQRFIGRRNVMRARTYNRPVYGRLATKPSRHQRNHPQQVYSPPYLPPQ